MVFVSVLDEKNSAIIVEDIGDEAEEEKLQQPDNLDNVDIDIVDFGPEGEEKGALKYWNIEDFRRYKNSSTSNI